MKFEILALLVVATLSLAAESEQLIIPTKLQSWTSSDGRSMNAKITDIDKDKKTVALEKEDGTKMTGVPFSRFSKEEQERLADAAMVSTIKENITSVSSEMKAMNAAMQRARDTFPAAYKVIEKDFKRVIPALERVMIKARFVDPNDPEKHVENMWVGDYTFDGKIIKGILMSTPGTLKSVKNGDEVEVKLEDLSDWSYEDANGLHGLFTERVLHENLSPEDKIKHNEATGVDWDALIKKDAEQAGSGK